MRVDPIKRRMATSAAARVFWLTLVVSIGWVAMVYLSKREVTVPDSCLAMVQDKKPWFKKLFSKEPENVQFITGPKTVPVRSEVQASAVRRQVQFTAELIVADKRLIRRNHWYQCSVDGTLTLDQQALQAELDEQKLRTILWKALGEEGKLWEHKDGLQNRISVCVNDAFRNQGVRLSVDKVSPLLELQNERKAGLDLKFSKEPFLSLEVAFPSAMSFFPSAAVPLALLVICFLGSLGFLGPAFYALAFIVPCLASRQVRRTVRHDPNFKSNDALDALAAASDALSWYWWPPLSGPDSPADALGDLAQLLPGDGCCDGAGALDADCCPGDAGCVGDCDLGGCDCGGCDC